MEVAKIRKWQKEHFSSDKEAHIQSSTDELEKHIDKELKSFFRKKGYEFAKRIKKDDNTEEQQSE